MKLPNRQIVLTTISVLVIVGLTSGVGYAAYNASKPTQNASRETIPAEPRSIVSSVPTEATEPEPTPTPTAPVQTSPDTQVEPTPVIPVVVRSFEEIISDYPNMSTGAPGFPECAGYMKNAFPEMFLDHNREQNIKGVSERFMNVCAAIELKRTRGEMYVLGVHFQQRGIR